MEAQEEPVTAKTTKTTETLCVAGGDPVRLAACLLCVRGVTGARPGTARARGTPQRVAAVCVAYTPAVVGTESLVALLLAAVDPTAAALRPAPHVLAHTAAQARAAAAVLARAAPRYTERLVVVVGRLAAFHASPPSEEQPQQSLAAPLVPRALRDRLAHAPTKPDAATLRARLTAVQYAVTQCGATERPCARACVDGAEPRAGLYVDVVTGEPLFAAAARVPSCTGWPAFRAPVRADAVVCRALAAHDMVRLEVRSAHGDSHLGFVFRERGGPRYCINRAALRFVPCAAQGAEDVPACAAAAAPLDDGGASGCNDGCQHTLSRSSVHQQHAQQQPAATVPPEFNVVFC